MWRIKDNTIIKVTSSAENKKDVTLNRGNDKISVECCKR